MTLTHHFSSPNNSKTKQRFNVDKINMNKTFRMKGQLTGSKVLLKTFTDKMKIRDSKLGQTRENFSN